MRSDLLKEPEMRLLTVMEVEFGSWENVNVAVPKRQELASKSLQVETVFSISQRFFSVNIRYRYPTDRKSVV